MTRRASSATPTEPAGEAAAVRVAIYTRISTDEERQPNSLEAQRLRLDSFVASQPGWLVERRYEDQFTGTVIDRPALTRLLRDAALGRFDMLLVYRVDRLARSIRGLAQVIDDLDQAGVLFRSATEPFDTGTPAGRMMVQMLGVFAEFERALIVERITAGLERKAARGGWCGGQRPYGYDIAADRDHLQRNPTEAPLVPVMFDRYANERIGSATLASWLNEQGHRTKNGRPWNHMSVLTVLRNRSYLGEIYYRGNWYPAPHEPLISTDLFDRAQAILTERGEDKSKRRSNASDYLLTGRVRCGRCGQTYIDTAARGRSGRYTYYTCFTRHRYGTKHCQNDRLPAEQLEQAVTRRLWKILADHELIDRAIAQAHERLAQHDDRQHAELEAVQSKLKETRATMNRYFQAFETAAMPEQTCAPRLASLAEQASALEARASELAALQDTDEPPQHIAPAELRALRQQLRSILNSGNPTQVKPIIQAMTEEIRVDGRDHIEPTFLIPAVRPLAGPMDLRREFSNSAPSTKSLVKRLLRRVPEGAKTAQESPVTVFEDARGPNVRVLRQVQRRLSPAELEALIAEYEAGARVCELAKVYELHRTTVAKHVARAGKTRPVMTEAQIDEAVVLYRDGWTLHNVGHHLGVADQTIRRVLVERAVTIRPGGRRRMAAAV